MGTPPLTRRTFLSAASAGALVTLGGPVLAACGDDDSGGSSGNEKVTIEWWNISTTEPGKTLFPQIAKAYMAAHPNVTIKITALENQAYKDKMTALTSSGKLPDVFHTWGGGVLKQQVDAGLVADLTDKVSSWSGTLTPISMGPYQFDGKTYGVPYDIGMVGFWYNKKLFARAGISALPTTWTQYLEVIKKLKAAGITPIALAGKEKWPGHYYWSYLVLRIGGLPALQQAQSSNDFSGPAFVQAGQRLKELADLAPFQPGFQGAGYPTPGGEAATMGGGKAAMELMGQWAPSVQKDASGKDLGQDLGFFTFPVVEGGQGKATDVFGGGGGHSLRKGAPDAAVDFLKYFVNPETEGKLIASEGYMPVVKGAESQIKDANRKLVAQTINQASGFQLFLDQAFPPAVGQEVNDAVADLIAGKKSPEQVAQQVTKTARGQ